MPIIVNKLGEHRNEKAVEYLIYYMASSQYAGCAGGRGIVSVWPEQVVADFNFVKNAYDKEDRKRVGHIIIGTNEKEQIIGPELVEIAEYVSAYLYQKGFQSFYVIHRGSDAKSDYLHLHMAVNTINFLDGKRYYETYGNASDLKNVLSMRFNQYNWFLINDNSTNWEEN